MKKILGLLILLGIFTVMPVSAAGVTAGVMSAEKGADNNTINLLVSGVEATNGLSQIDCDVWSAYNSQDDIRNYVLADDGAGEYTGSFNIADHYYDNGLYYIAVFATDGSGNRESLGLRYALIEVTTNTWTEYEVKGGAIVGTDYGATLFSSATISPNVDANNTSELLKSGYGFTLDVNSTTSVSDDHLAEDTVTPVQNVNTIFPEFNYNYGVIVNGVRSTYNRLGDNSDGAIKITTENSATTSEMGFKENEFSTDDRRVHFTPLWYPDGTSYKIGTDIFDSWTPAGMLSTSVTPGTNINGHVYEDWHIAPILND